MPHWKPALTTNISLLIPDLDLLSYAVYISEGIHFGYAYISSVILCIFVADYSSPVLFNVFISTFISINIFKIIKYLGFRTTQFIILLIFLIKYPRFMVDAVIEIIKVFKIFYKISKNYNFKIFFIII